MPFLAVGLALLDAYVAFFGWQDVPAVFLGWSGVLILGCWILRRWWPEDAPRALILTSAVVIWGMSPRIFGLVAGSFVIVLGATQVVWRWRLGRSVSLEGTARLLGGLLALFLLFYLTLWLRAWFPFPTIRWHGTAPLALRPASTPPDIYYIVLDGYGRHDVLQRWYGLDNTPFLEQLRARGFWVIDKAYANYPRTNLVLAATWNMEYVHTLFTTDREFLIAHQTVLTQSPVFASLRAAGYTLIQVEGTWDWSNMPEAVDMYVKPKPISWLGFQGHYLSRTPLRGLLYLSDSWITWPSIENHRALIRHALARLPEIATWPGPKMVFAHIIAPHPPFVFTSDGSPRPVEHGFTLFDGKNYPGSTIDYREGYAAQVRFLNRALLPVFDRILSASSRPAVILLQGDHGPGSMTDFQNWEESCLEERFPILLALRLPGIAPPEREVLTPVNLFRLVFNAYFGTDLPLLEDRAFAPQPGRTFLPVYEVTERLQAPSWYNCDVP